MNPYRPSDDFTEKVMAQVRRLYKRRQRQLFLIEKMLGALPIRTLLSLAAIFGGLWNLLRLYLLLSPAICR